VIYLNEKIVPESKALVSVFDHGFLYGDGIYETLRAYKGLVFKIDEHALCRLRTEVYLRAAVLRDALMGFEHHVAVSMVNRSDAIAEALDNYLGWDVYHHI
jgi:hypothetical protein